MKKWLPGVIAIALIGLVGLAFCCGGKCGKACGKAAACCPDRPDWGYAYQTADFYPDTAPRELKQFHKVLIPVREARKSGETAYVRENARQLYKAAKRVRKSRPDVAPVQRKHYAQAARELVSDSKRLKRIVHGGSDDAVIAQVKCIEEDFIRLANLSD